MPMYEYECSGCNKVLEIQQKFSDDPLKECPECGAEVTRLISRSSFHLKGGGWYATDYKESGSSSSSSSASGTTKETKETKENSPKSDSSNTSESKEKKPEPKKEAKKESKS